MDKPVVVVFGPTSTQYTDVNLGKTIIVREEVDCSPCQLKDCPIDHRCMERLQHERVLTAAKELMERHVLRS
jgi:heptosyltransferase-2